MNVYILSFGEYSDASVVGVYSTLEKAKAAALEYVRRGTCHYCADIEMVTVDSPSWNDDAVTSVLTTSSIPVWLTPERAAAIEGIDWKEVDE